MGGGLLQRAAVGASFGACLRAQRASEPGHLSLRDLFPQGPPFPVHPEPREDASSPGLQGAWDLKETEHRW